MARITCEKRYIPGMVLNSLLSRRNKRGDAENSGV